VTVKFTATKLEAYLLGARISPQARLRAEQRAWDEHERYLTELIDDVTVDPDYTETHALIEQYQTYIDERDGEISANEAEHMASHILHTAETADREAQERAAKMRTRAEWEALEYEHITRAHDREDYDNAIAELLIAGRIKEKQAEWARARLRVCAAWNCESVFIAKDLRAKYCCKACEREQNAARARLATTGTYLPREAYVDKRTQSREKAWKRNVVSLDAMSNPREGLDIYEVIDSDGSFAMNHKPEPLTRDLVEWEMKKYQREGRFLPQPFTRYIAENRISSR